MPKEYQISEQVGNKFCTGCGTPLREGANFCSSCRQDVKKALKTDERTVGNKFCTGCGTPLREGANFCSTCGHEVKRTVRDEKVEKDSVNSQNSKLSIDMIQTPDDFIVNGNISVQRIRLCVTTQLYTKDPALSKRLNGLISNLYNLANNDETKAKYGPIHKLRFETSIEMEGPEGIDCNPRSILGLAERSKGIHDQEKMSLTANQNDFLKRASIEYNLEVRVILDRLKATFQMYEDVESACNEIITFATNINKLRASKLGHQRLLPFDYDEAYEVVKNNFNQETVMQFIKHKMDNGVTISTILNRFKDKLDKKLEIEDLKQYLK